MCSSEHSILVKRTLSDITANEDPLHHLCSHQTRFPSPHFGPQFEKEEKIAQTESLSKISAEASLMTTCEAYRVFLINEICQFWHKNTNLKIVENQAKCWAKGLGRGWGWQGSSFCKISMHKSINAPADRFIQIFKEEKGFLWNNLALIIMARNTHQLWLFRSLTSADNNCDFDQRFRTYISLTTCSGALASYTRANMYW